MHSGHTACGAVVSHAVMAPLLYINWTLHFSYEIYIGILYDTGINMDGANLKLCPQGPTTASSCRYDKWSVGLGFGI